MAINKVEYKLDSMTAGFASAGDEVIIKKSNAETIKEDVDNEKTENLSNSQQKYLAKCVESSNSDDTDYDGGEAPDGELEEGNAAGNDDDGPGAGAGVATMAQAGAAVFFGALALKGIQLNTPKMCAWVAPWVGAINLGLAAMSVANAATFDGDYSKRTSERNEAEGYAATLDEAMAALNEDIESLKGNQKLSDLQKLQEQYQSYIEEGKIDEADALLSQMEETRTELLEGDAAIDIESIGLNNEFAHEYEDYSSNVAEFLKTGNSYGSIGVVNSVALVACTAASIVMSALAFRAVNLANVSLAVSGAALCVSASIMYAVASAVMINKSVQEFDCGAKGNDLASKVNEMAKPLEEHDNIAQALGVFEEVADETAGLSTEGTGDNTGSGTSEGGGDSGTSEGGGDSGAGAAGGTTSGGSSGGSSSNNNSNS